MTIYDVLGNELAVIINEVKPAGEYPVDIDNSRVELTSGVLFYQLKAGDFNQTRNMVVIK